MASPDTAASDRLPPGFFDQPIAHRGLHDVGAGVVENTRSAVAAAIGAGYGIEIDVQLTADGEAIVFHDATLERLIGAAGRVRDQSAAALQAMRLRDAPEAPPTLGAVLAVVEGRAPLVVEVKAQEDGVGLLEDRVAALLSEYRGAVAVMSFSAASVSRLAARAPAIARGLVTVADASNATDRAEAETMDVDFASYDWRALPTAATRRLRAAGRPVICWTVRSAEEAAAVAPHADQITFEGFRP